MDGSPEGGDESPDSQGHATDWRFAVCSFRDAWDEEELAPQTQVKDPNPPRPPAGAPGGEPLPGNPLPGELPSPPGQITEDGSGDGKRGTLGGSSGKSEEPVASKMESILCPMSSHLSLAQDESTRKGGGLASDPVPDRVIMPAGLDPGELDSDRVHLGDPLSETSSELLETGKGGWAGVSWKGMGVPRGECQDLERALTLLRLKSRSKEGISEEVVQSSPDPSHFPSQDPSESSLPKPTDCLLAQDLTWELLASGMAALPGSRRD